MKQYAWNTMSGEEQHRILSRPALTADGRLEGRVAELVARVRDEGDAALTAISEELDGVALASFEAPESEHREAESALTETQKQAIQAAAANIERFHRLQLPRDLAVETSPGVRCERVTRPIGRVGLYVPAGTAPLPSTALMLGIPARLAGCPVRILCTPARAGERADPAVLYAAGLCGITRVFKLGGAQAIAAMAYGTETVPKVDKIFGPGNAWVTAAKALVAQDPAGAARDMPAGPSEVMVVADAQADPSFVAADLLSQAEHGPDSQVLLVATSADLIRRVLEQIDAQKEQLSRREAVEKALQHSSAILVDDLATALEVVNRYAPEHLILQVERPREWLGRVEAAGSVFLGPWAPESVGDYCSGTNHVLPTHGFARSYSSLGVADFVRAMTVQELSVEGLRSIGPVAQTLAALEGLDAHGEAVRRRLAKAANGDDR